MTLLQMQQRLARRRGGGDTSLNPTTGLRYRDALNESHKAVLRMPGMEMLRYAPLTVTSVSGQQFYGVPHEGIARIDRIWDSTTNKRKLDFLTLSQMRDRNPAGISSTPYAWGPIGWVEAHTQPSAASELFVKSTSTSDTTVVAYVEGYITGGYYRTASVTLTGTTGVTLTSAITTFVEVTKFYLSGVAVGTVTLLQTSGAGTELSRVTIGKTRARFYGIFFEPIPAAVIAYSCDVLREIPDMVIDADEPLLPEDFHDLLIDKAELKELRKQDDPTRHRLLLADIASAERDLRTFVINHPDWRPQMGGGRAGINTVGSWYPADVWVQ